MKQLFYYLAQIHIDPNEITVPKGDLTNPKLQVAWRVALGLAGAIAVLIITIAGFRYVVSAGDPQSAAKAKNAIIYTLVGLVVALSAFGIVSFVLTRL
jgi:hypothetical protein